MAKTVIGEQGCYKLDHPNFREVYETTFIEDKITNIHLGADTNNNLLDLPNTCEVEDSGVLPVFYNCKAGCYTDKTGQRVGEDLGIPKDSDNEALFDGVKAFRIGETVKVLCENSSPKYIVGHADHTPRMCADIFKMKIRAWNGLNHYAYYVGSTASAYCEVRLDDGCKDPYDYPLKDRCTEKGYNLFGKKEFRRGTVQTYWGDFFVRTGPIMYILRVESLGFPGPITGRMVLWGAIWSTELEAECKRLGEAAEKTIPIYAFGPWPVQPVYPPEVRYQSIFTYTFFSRFAASWSKPPHPRWIYTEFWGEN